MATTLTNLPLGEVNEHLLETLTALGPLPVVKCGEQGAVSVDGESVVRVEAMPTLPIDTIGAGDSFDAGFIYGHLHGWTLERSLAFCGGLRLVVDPFSRWCGRSSVGRGSHRTECRAPGCATVGLEASMTKWLVSAAGSFNACVGVLNLHEIHGARLLLPHI